MTADSEKRPGCFAGLLRALAEAFGPGGGEKRAGPAYRKREYLFSKAERSFYEVLCRCVGDDYVVFAKVRMCDIIDPSDGKGRQSALNRINSKHVDFLVCDRERVQPRLVIELDDSSHRRQDRVTRDDFVKAAFASAGIPIINQPCKQAYVMEEVAAAVKEGLRAKEK